MSGPLKKYEVGGTVLKLTDADAERMGLLRKPEPKPVAAKPAAAPAKPRKASTRKRLAPKKPVSDG